MANDLAAVEFAFGCQPCWSYIDLMRCNENIELQDLTAAPSYPIELDLSEAECEEPELIACETEEEVDEIPDEAVAWSTGDLEVEDWTFLGSKHQEFNVIPPPKRVNSDPLLTGCGAGFWDDNIDNWSTIVAVSEADLLERLVGEGLAVGNV